MNQPKSRLNLIDEPRDHLMTMMRRVHERAIMDFDEGIGVDFHSGFELLELAGVKQHRAGHRRLATVIYNTTIRSLEESRECHQ